MHICIFGIFLYSQTCIPGWMMSHSWPALLHINEFINVPAGFIGLGKQWWTVQTWMMKYEIATGSTTFIESMNWMYEVYWVFIDLFILHFDTVMCELFSACLFEICNCFGVWSSFDGVPVRLLIDLKHTNALTILCWSGKMS